MWELKIKRIYASFDLADGYRVLVDRLWPRGLSKEQANIDLWAKEIAPSTTLRHFFHSNPQAGDVFRQEYLAELDQNEHASIFLERIRKELKDNPVTLLYATKEEKLSHAPILKSWLEKKDGKRVGFPSSTVKG